MNPFLSWLLNSISEESCNFFIVSLGTLYSGPGIADHDKTDHVHDETRKEFKPGEMEYHLDETREKDFQH